MARALSSSVRPLKYQTDCQRAPGSGPPGQNETPGSIPTHSRKVYNMGCSRPTILPELLLIAKHKKELVSKPSSAHH